MVGVLSLNVVDCGHEPWSGQTKDYKISICCFSDKHAALKSKSKDWLDLNQGNVSSGATTSTYRLLFHWASNVEMKLRLSI